jgi:Flp pilus assembly protein TadG
MFIRLRLRRFATCCGASSAAEFALVFPLLVVLMFGVICIGQAFYAVASSQWAIERSVRQLMIDRTTTHAEIEAEVRALLPRLRDLDVSVSFTDDNTGALPATRVLADFSHPIEVPFITRFNLQYRLQTTAMRPF